MPDSRALAVSAARLLGSELRTVEALHGGDLSQVVRLALADGRMAVAKAAPFTAREAAMLRAIAATGAAAPQVLAMDEDVLVMQSLADDGRMAWEDLAGQLARLHAASCGRYGWAEDYAFGPVRIANGWSGDWPGFWADNRLRPFLPGLPAALARRLAKLADGLAGRLPQARPALLHGDLWGGNVLSAAGRVTGLIDPACYYGDAEVDLAMLSLFDRPPEAFRAAYGPLEPGWEARRPVYQLWPALVHVRLFGDGYLAMTGRLLDAAAA